MTPLHLDLGERLQLLLALVLALTGTVPGLVVALAVMLRLGTARHVRHRRLASEAVPNGYHVHPRA